MKRRAEALIHILLLEEEEEELLELMRIFPSLKRRKTHEMIKNRETEGTHSILISKYLMCEEDRFITYFRITPNLFNEILSNIRSEIKSMPCNRVPVPISCAQKLCIALR